MAYRVFTLAVRDPGVAETELNGFLASHRVLSVDRRFVEDGGSDTGTHLLLTVGFSVRDSGYSLRAFVRVSGLPARDIRTHVG